MRSCGHPPGCRMHSPWLIHPIIQEVLAVDIDAGAVIAGRGELVYTFVEVQRARPAYAEVISGYPRIGRVLPPPVEVDLWPIVSREGRRALQVGISIVLAQPVWRCGACRGRRRTGGRGGWAGRGRARRRRGAGGPDGGRGPRRARSHGRCCLAEPRPHPTVARYERGKRGGRGTRAASGGRRGCRLA